MSSNTYAQQAGQWSGESPAGDESVSRAAAVVCMPYEPPRVRIAGNLRDLVAQTGSDIDQEERRQNEGTPR